MKLNHEDVWACSALSNTVKGRRNVCFSLAPVDFCIQWLYHKGQAFKIVLHIKQHQITARRNHQTQIAANPREKNNSCFMSASKRKRLVSVPVGQPSASESALKLMSPHNYQGLSQRYKLQPRVIRVTAYKNGSGTAFANITAPTIALLLEACTHKPYLNMAAGRVFLADGTEALKPEDIPHEANIYVSTGEPFLNPFKKIKDHLLLMKRVTWTMHGLMLPTDVKRQKTKPVLSRRMKTLARKTSVRILVFKNGIGPDGHELTVGKKTIRKVLDACTVKMNLDSPDRYIYDMNGRKIEDISKTCTITPGCQTGAKEMAAPPS